MPENDDKIICGFCGATDHDSEHCRRSTLAENDDEWPEWKPTKEMEWLDALKRRVMSRPAESDDE